MFTFYLCISKTFIGNIFKGNSSHASFFSSVSHVREISNDYLSVVSSVYLLLINMQDYFSESEADSFFPCFLCVYLTNQNHKSNCIVNLISRYCFICVHLLLMEYLELLFLY